MQVVNYLLRDWIKSLESKGSVTLPLLDDAEAIQYDLTKDVEFIREGSKKLVRVRFFGSQFSIWNQIQSQIKARFRNIGMRPQWRPCMYCRLVAVTTRCRYAISPDYCNWTYRVYCLVMAVRSVLSYWLYSCICRWICLVSGSGKQCIWICNC